MSNSLVQRQESALAVPNESDFGNLPARPPQPIRCTIGQPTSRKGETGKFNFSQPDWPAVDKLNRCVILAPRATRVLFGETFESPSRCGSDNFHTPAARYTNPVSESCATCPASKWPNEVDTQEGVELRDALVRELKPKRPNIPLCTEMVNLVLVDERMVPFMMQFHKTQLKNVYDNLINVFRYSGKRLFSQSFDIGIKKIVAGSGVYFECVFSNFTDLEPTVLKTVAELNGFWAKMAEAALAEQHAKMDAEKEAQEIG